MRTIRVDLDDRSYDVVVGAGVRDQLASMLPPQARRVAVITQQSIPHDVELTIETRTFLIGDGESHKSLSTIEGLCRGFAGWGLTRGDVVVGLGGGMVTDVAAFAAAVYHRGVPVVHVATTLLAQVDAAIGGKSGVNLPEGKNLVGAFWQPRGVICDTDTLATLPAREYRNGLGELVKYQFLVPHRFDDLPLEEQVARCVEIKANVVQSDEREAGRRAILNYGHTLGHAVETATDFAVSHGEAVAIGIHFVALLAQRLGRITDARVEEHRSVLAQYGLPMTVPEGVDPEHVIALMCRDKKSIDGITFVLDGPSGLELVPGVAEEDVRATLHEIAR